MKPEAIGVLGISNTGRKLGDDPDHRAYLFDDMAQYWWHRAHHSGEYMSVRIVYRNNIFYYLTMPSFWFSGALIYLGLGWVYVPYVIVKQLVIHGAHSDVRWDEPLYKIKWLSPIMWVVERTISTPATGLVTAPQG